MAYIRAKTYKRKRRPSDKWPEHSTYYYVVQSYRVEGKVRQVTIAYLGEFSTVQEALAFDTTMLKRIEEGLPKWEARHAELSVSLRAVLERIKYAGGVQRAGVARPGTQQVAEYRKLGTAIEAAPREIARLQEHIASLREAAAALGIADTDSTTDAHPKHWRHRIKLRMADDAMILTRTIGRA